MTSRSRFAKSARSARGFSLVELLCVLVILIIMVTMLGGRLSGSRRRSNLELCRKNLQTLYLTLTLYANDNHGSFPRLNDAPISAAPLSLLVPRSTTETAMFICPGAADKALPEGEPFARRRISYAYYMGRSTNNSPAAQALVSDWQVNSLPKTTGRPLFSADGRQPGNNHDKDGGNILLDSGEVLRSGPAAACDLPLPPGVILLNPVP